MPRSRSYKTSSSVPDSVISCLDRGGIWNLLWDMRFAKASFRSIRAVRKRWERLTGRRYYE